MSIIRFLPTKKHIDLLVKKNTRQGPQKIFFKISETNFYHFYFNKKYKCLFVSKTHQTSQMTEEQYKAQIINWQKINTKYRPEKILVDNSAFDFIIRPDLQSWVSDNLLKKSENIGIRKIAFILSPNIFTNVSIRQAMEEENLLIQFKFFDNIEQAKQWLGITDH